MKKTENLKGWKSVWKQRWTLFGPFLHTWLIQKLQEVVWQLKNIINR